LLRRKLLGGLVSQTKTPPECGNPKGGRAGSREPPFMNEAPPEEHTGASVVPPRRSVIATRGQWTSPFNVQVEIACVLRRYPRSPKLFLPSCMVVPNV